jgi:hypothetical protein
MLPEVPPLPRLSSVRVIRNFNVCSLRGERGAGNPAGREIAFVIARLHVETRSNRFFSRRLVAAIICDN